jgi:hypothetical protein
MTSRDETGAEKRHDEAALAITAAIIATRAKPELVCSVAAERLADNLHSIGLRHHWFGTHYTKTLDVLKSSDPIGYDEFIAIADQLIASCITAGREWTDIAVVPPPADGSKFDAWCVRPGSSTMAIRITDVSMRGDKSGFGFIDHTMEGPIWHYLGRQDNVYPEWEMTHWMPRPKGPVPTTSDGVAA